MVRSLFVTVAHATILSLIAAASGGCGDDESPSAGETGEPPPPAQEPDPLGSACEEPGLMGWQTTCHVGSAYAWYDGAEFLSNEEEFVLGDLYGDGLACSQGCAPAEVADAACHTRCLEKLCGEVKAWHDDHVGALCGTSVDCTFPMIECITGQLTDVQIIQTGVSSISEFFIGCFDVDAQPDPGPDGCFPFLTSEEETMPPTCQLPVEMEMSPRDVVSDYVAVGRAGTSATASWVLDGQPDLVQAEDLSVQLSYAVVPCAQAPGECLELGWLAVDLPETKVGGIAIRSAYARVIAVRDAPQISRDGTFSFSPGSLDLLLTANTEGPSVHVAASNSDTVSGRLSPDADALSLSGLSVRYSDSFLDATLRIDVQGSFVERAPEAVIGVVQAPRECDSPVAFRAASVDPDRTAMTHDWLLDGESRAVGELFEAVLPSGRHTLKLVSRDAAGYWDTAQIDYDRICR